MKQVILDIECFQNYFLISFLKCEDGKVKNFEFSGTNTLDASAIEDIVNSYEIITFNGESYDLPLLSLAMLGADTEALKRASDDIIVMEMLSWQVRNKHRIPELAINHIDLIQVFPLKASLKIYAARLHYKKMQDLPCNPNSNLTREEMVIVKDYCKNDLMATKTLLDYITPQIELRRKMSNQYKCDLRSKSDAQIAETVIKSEVMKKTGKPIPKAEKPTSFKYAAPDYIKFTGKQLNHALELFNTIPFQIDQSGRPRIAPELAAMKIELGRSKYQMGMGGLHSTEKAVHYVADKNTLLCDNDVASFYPAIILNLGLYPKQLGKEFLEVYQEIVTARLAGKAVKNMVIADSLRIVINGSFGKLGSPYSILYAPELMVQVTITGQLVLLMLIETLELNGISVVSGNTDGIVIRCHKSKEEVMTSVIKDWEIRTCFSMERSDYTGIYNRDVNNYIAVKADGKIKTKGCFSVGGAQKNPVNEICNIAMVKYLTEGIDIEDTITECKDITKFLTVRTVEGGAVKGKVYLGKAIRWFYSSTVTGTINYKTNNNTVPRSFGARPCLDLPDEFPKDIDYKWYIKETKELMKDVGINITGQMDLF